MPVIRRNLTPRKPKAPATVAFASEGAAARAAKNGLVAADFKGVDPSGKNGYTVGDVEYVAAIKKAL